METRDPIISNWFDSRVSDVPERTPTPDQFEMLEPSDSEQSDAPPVEIRPFVRPAKHRALSDFTLHELLSSDTSHEVYKATYETEDQIIDFIYKKVPDNSLMCQLEAVAANLFELLATSDYIPATFAVYDKDPETGEEKCVGVASEEIPDFKPLAKDGLTMEDLDITFIKKRNLTITQLEQLHEELKWLEKEKLTLSRQLRKLENNKKKIQTRFHNFSKARNDSQEYTEEYATESIKINRRNTLDTLEVEEKQFEITGKIKAFEERMSKEFRGLTVDELKRFRISKGLGITLAASYILIEEDLHKNNLDKTGRRFDCDMTLWEIYEAFKTRNALSKVFSPRDPGFHTSVITAYDIAHFPNLRDCILGYWPSQKAYSIPSLHLVTESIRIMTRAVKSNLNIRINDYTEEENEIFKTLETNVVCKDYANATFIKFTFTNKLLYQDITNDHLQSHYRHTFKGKNDFLDSHIVELVSFRRKIFQDELLSIPECRDFFKKNYSEITQKLLTQLKSSGLVYQNTDFPEEKYDISDITLINKRSEELLDLIEHEEAKNIEKPRRLSDLTPRSDEKSVNLSMIEVNVRSLVERYRMMDKMIRMAMATYKCTDSMFGGVYCFWKTHTALADVIVKKCNEIQQSIPVSSEIGYINGMAILYSYINKKLAIFEKDKSERESRGETVDPGGMHITLINLSADLAKILLPEVSLAVMMMEQEVSRESGSKLNQDPGNGLR